MDSSVRHCICLDDYARQLGSVGSRHDILATVGICNKEGRAKWLWLSPSFVRSLGIGSPSLKVSGEVLDSARAFIRLRPAQEASRVLFVELNAYTSICALSAFGGLPLGVQLSAFCKQPHSPDVMLLLALFTVLGLLVTAGLSC